MTSVWITRALPGAQDTADRLRALGFEPRIGPLLEVRALGSAPIDLQGVGALAFTSANGVRAFALRSAIRNLPLFTVGDSTAHAAQAEGFASVTSAQGDVRALGRLIADQPHPPGEILHLSAREPAGDLLGALAKVGVPARRLDLYETVEIEPSGEDLAALTSVDAILVYSPRAATILGRILRQGPVPHGRVLCLSPAVAAALGDFSSRNVLTAPSPHEPALLGLLES